MENIDEVTVKMGFMGQIGEMSTEHMSDVSMIRRDDVNSDDKES